MQYHQNTEILFAAALLRGLGNANPVYYGPFTLGMTIYSGTAPTAAQVIANWSLYNAGTSNYLVHYDDGAWSQPGSGNLLTLTPLTARTPVHAGVASWAIIWGDMGTGRSPNNTELGSTTLPRTAFMIVSVSGSIGDGVLRFADLNFTTSAAVPISDGSIGVNL